MRKNETRKQAVARVATDYTLVKTHDIGGACIYTVWLKVFNQSFQVHPEPFDSLDEAELFRESLATALQYFLAVEAC